VIETRGRTAGLTIRPGAVDFELVNPENDPRYRDYWDLSRGHGAARRHPDLARAIMRTNTTAIGASWSPRRGRQPDLRHLRAVSAGI
jgi:malate dehydrogenase (oxaloacetate-decarboxylating)(NADP+)